MTEQDRELAVCRRFVEELLSHGFRLSVFDGAGVPVALSTNADEIVKALRSTDQDIIRVASPESPRTVGWLSFVYGNDPSEVLHDHTLNLQEFITAAEAFAEEQATC